jgi:hypothetical protein
VPSHRQGDVDPVRRWKCRLEQARFRSKKKKEELEHFQAKWIRFAVENAAKSNES